MRESRGWGFFSYLGGVDHLACHIVRKYRRRGPPVVFLGKQRIEGQMRVALERGTHKSMLAYSPF